MRGRLISISEAVKLYSIKKDFYYSNMKNGTLPFPWYPLAMGKRFVNTADIEEWIEKVKVPAGKFPGEI